MSIQLSYILCVCYKVESLEKNKTEFFFCIFAFFDSFPNSVFQLAIGVAGARMLVIK